MMHCFSNGPWGVRGWRPRQSSVKFWRTGANSSSRVPSRNQKSCRVVLCPAENTCTVESVCRQVNNVLATAGNPLHRKSPPNCSLYDQSVVLVQTRRRMPQSVSQFAFNAIDPIIEIHPQR